MLCAEKRAFVGNWQTRCLSTSCSDAELTMDRNVSKSPTGNEEYDSLLEGIFKQMEGLRSYGIEHSCQQGDGLIEHSKLDLKAPVKMVTGSGFIRASPEAVLEVCHLHRLVVCRSVRSQVRSCRNAAAPG